VLPSILSINQKGWLENRKIADVLANIRDVIIQAGSRNEKKEMKYRITSYDIKKALVKIRKNTSMDHELLRFPRNIHKIDQ
jgi:hypothetical protein